MSPSSTKSSPNSGSITLVSASWTSSTVGINKRVVGSSGYAGLGADSRLHRGSDRGALPDLPRRRRDRRIADAPTPGRRFADVLGLALLIPPTRSAVRRKVERRIGRRVQVGTRPQQ